MTSPNAIVTWQCPRHPSPVVEVLQSCPNLLYYLCDISSSERMGRPPSPHRKLFILFPGNPGVVHFYEKFVELMKLKRFDVLVMGFAGHSIIDLNNGKIFDLQDQLDTAEQFLTTVFSPHVIKWYGNHIYIGGHSIGAFVAFNMVSRFPCIKRCFSLCGVISKIQKSPNGELLFFFGSNLLIYSLITWVVVSLLWMPKVFLSLFIRWQCSTIEPSLQQLMTKHLNRSLIKNCFGMAKQEFQLVGDIDKPLMKSVEERMVFYYVKSDKWAPPTHAYEVRETCEGNAGFVMEENTDIPHAWCLTHNEVIIENGIMPFV